MTKIISNSFNVTPVYDGNDGAPGKNGEDDLSVQVASQSVQYAKRTAAQGPVDDPSTLTYGNYPSSLSKGDWLYSRTTVYYQYSNGTSAGSTITYGVTYIGKDGDTIVNKGVSSITEHYKASDSDTGESTPSSTDWGTTMPTDWGSSKKYLWNYEKIVYTDGSITRTTASVIAVYSQDGKGISAITNYYLATSASSGVTRDTLGWTTSVQAVTASNKYLWNYEKIEYTTGDPSYTDPHIIGVYGDKGDTGTGIASIAATFNLSKNGTSTNESTAPTNLYYNSWQSSQPAPTDTYPYVWKKEVTTYKNPTSTETKYYCIAAKGTRGKTGPMFYLCGQFPDKAPYSKDDYRCPVVYYGAEYWYLKADSASASDTPSASSSVWGKAEKFDMVFTDVLFVKDFAKLGSGIINGDWLISCAGYIVINGEKTYYGPDSMYAHQPAYLRFNPDYPNSDNGYQNFMPVYAVDLKTGKTYQQTAYVEGTIKADIFYHKVTYLRVSNSVWFDSVSAITIVEQDRVQTTTVTEDTVYLPYASEYDGLVCDIYVSKACSGTPRTLKFHAHGASIYSISSNAAISAGVTLAVGQSMRVYSQNGLWWLLEKRTVPA